MIWRRVLLIASIEVFVQPSAGPCSATVPAVPSHSEDVTEAFKHTCSHEPRLSASRAILDRQGAAIKQQ